MMHMHVVVNAMQIRKSVLNQELDPRWLKYMPGWQEIPDDIQASRELYKNLFEAPIVLCAESLSAGVKHILRS